MHSNMGQDARAAPSERLHARAPSIARPAPPCSGSATSARARGAQVRGSDAAVCLGVLGGYGLRGQVINKNKMKNKK